MKEPVLGTQVRSQIIDKELVKNAVKTAETKFSTGSEGSGARARAQHPDPRNPRTAGTSRDASTPGRRAPPPPDRHPVPDPLAPSRIDDADSHRPCAGETPALQCAHAATTPGRSDSDRGGGSDSGRGRDSGRNSGSDRGTGPAPVVAVAECSADVSAHEVFGWSSRQVIARTSSNSLRAFSALRRSIAPHRASSRRWQSTSFAEA